MIYSVVTPVYNAEQYLPACLDSVLSQDTSSEYEVILVDDGSTDRSGTICDEYAALTPCIHVIHQKNGGASAARNVGIRAAQGLYILFLDADDLLSPDFFVVLDRLTQSNPDLVTFSARRFFKQLGDGPAICQELLPAGECGRSWLERLFQNQALPCPMDWIYGYRRAFLEEHRLLFRTELRVSEDFDLVMRCLEYAESITGENKILYQYRYLPGSLSNQITMEKYLDDLLVKAEYYRKYPNTAMAGLYCSSVLNLHRTGNRAVARAAFPFLRENQDILPCATYKPYRLAAQLFRILGYYNGTIAYATLQNFWHKHGKTGALDRSLQIKNKK